jgi:hypothetical protein
MVCVVCSLIIYGARYYVTYTDDAVSKYFPTHRVPIRVDFNGNRLELARRLTEVQRASEVTEERVFALHAAPLEFANLRTAHRQLPLSPVHALVQANDVLGRCHVDKGVPKIAIVFEIDGQVQKVECALQIGLGIKLIQNFVPGVPVRNVADHDGRAFVVTALDFVLIDDAADVPTPLVSTGCEISVLVGRQGASLGRAQVSAVTVWMLLMLLLLLLMLLLLLLLRRQRRRLLLRWLLSARRLVVRRMVVLLSMAALILVGCGARVLLLVSIRAELLALDLEADAVDEHLVFLPLRLHAEDIITQSIDVLLLGRQRDLMMPHLLLLHDNHVCEGGCRWEWRKWEKREKRGMVHGGGGAMELVLVFS